MGKKNTLIQKLKLFKSALSSTMSVEKLLFFGSRTEGKAKKWSDVDLIIVSPNFRKKRPMERGLKLYAKWNIDYPVDFLCYTPEEFEKASKKVGIISHALKYGVAI
ncbi:MAG: nucleotidyltransferase domain-containing protein [Candidatus Micrarchaeota archaeon]